MNRYKITIQYDGSDFFGFQSQKDSNTIQNKIEKSLSLNWRDKNLFAQRLHKKTLLKRACMLSLVVIFIAGCYYNMAAYEVDKPVMTLFNKVSMESPITAYSLLLDRSIFPEKYH